MKGAYLPKYSFRLYTFCRRPNSITTHHQLCVLPTYCMPNMPTACYSLTCVMPSQAQQRMTGPTFTWNTSQSEMTNFDKGESLILSRHFSSIESEQQNAACWENFLFENERKILCTATFRQHTHLTRPNYAHLAGIPQEETPTQKMYIFSSTLMTS
jgi:hypothetical protein